jgi:hypothetical protein
VASSHTLNTEAAMSVRTFDTGALETVAEGGVASEAVREHLEREHQEARKSEKRLQRLQTKRSMAQQAMVASLASRGMSMLNVRKAVVRTPEELNELCGTDMFAIQDELSLLKRTLAELEREIKQEQYVRGCIQAETQKDYDVEFGMCGRWAVFHPLAL